MSESPAVHAPEPTGHAGVDEVVASLADLEGRPVQEHVAVFERAHESLRHALSEAGQQQSAPARA